MKHVVLSIFLSFFVISFSQTKTQKTLKTVEVAEVKAQLKKDKFIILDVRTAEEFAAGHIENAVNINFYAPDFLERLSRLNKTEKYIVYCAVGGRSGQALKKMEAQGFQYVLNLNGGYNAWKTQQ